MLKRGFAVVAAAAAVVCGLSMRASAAIYSDDFNSTTDATNYSVNITTGATGPSGDATFGYDYSALGIPAAPHTTDGSTLGLRLRTDNLQTTTQAGIVVGATEVATKGLTLPSFYVVSADVWGNYIGGTSLAASGSNGSNATGMGVGTKGTTLQSPNANDGFLADTFHDGGGGTNLDYRIYADGTRQDAATTPYFAAGESATAASHGNAYYTAFLPAQTAPTAQTTLSPATQGGSSPAGVEAFAWHTMTMTQDGTNVTWAIDGHTITTVPDSAMTFGGSQVSLDAFDSGLTGNSTVNGQLLNADIWDNITITPEPASLGLLAMAAIPLFRRRKA